LIEVEFKKIQIEKPRSKNKIDKQDKTKTTREIK